MNGSGTKMQQNRHANLSKIEIRGWFDSTNDENFNCLPESHPSFKSGDIASASAIVYITKPSCIPYLSMFSSEGIDLRCLPIIGRYGFPSDRDIVLLFDEIPKRTVYFVGDADPVDMMIFLYLQEVLPSSVLWFGVRDAIVKDMVGEQFLIPLSESERLAITHFPQLEFQCKELIGWNLANFFTAGKKLESEGFIHSQRAPKD